MPDHEVRLRMMRGRAACLGLEVIYCLPSRVQVIERIRSRRAIASMTVDATHQESITEAVQELMKLQSVDGEHVTFRMRLRNTGEITIPDFAIHVASTSDAGATVRFDGMGCSMTVDGNGHKFRLPREARAPAGEYREPPPKVFPGDYIDFPDGRWIIHLPYGRSVDDSDLTLRWKAFLDDAIPCEGTIAVLHDYRQAVEELTRQPEPEEYV